MIQPLIQPPNPKNMNAAKPLGGWLIPHRSYQQTLQIMDVLLGEWKKSVEVRQIVAGIVRGLPQDAPALVADAVYRFVRSSVRYTPDVHEVETIQVPVTTLALGIGDCDDMALLAATLLQAAGYSTSWWLLGYSSPQYPEHVAVHCAGMCVDCTLDTQFESPLDSVQFSKIWTGANYGTIHTAAG